MKVSFFKSPGFAITPEFHFENPILSVVLDFFNDIITPSLSIEATAKDSTGNFSLKGKIIIKEDYQNVTLTNDEDSVLKLSDLEKLFQSQSLNFTGFLPSNDLFNQLRNLYLTNLNIRVNIISFLFSINRFNNNDMLSIISLQI